MEFGSLVSTQLCPERVFSLALGHQNRQFQSSVVSTTQVWWEARGRAHPTRSRPSGRGEEINQRVAHTLPLTDTKSRVSHPDCQAASTP